MNAILLFGFLFSGIRVLTGAFIVFYMLNNGVSIVEVGIIKSVQALTMMLIDIPSGYFADKKSYKLSIVLAAVCSFIWLVLMGISSDFYGFLIAEVFNAFSLTLIAGAYNALLIQYSKSRNLTTKQVLATSSQYSFIAMFAFSLVGAYFADYNVEYIWYIAAILMLVTALFGLIALEDLKPEVKETNNHSLFADIKEMIAILFNIPTLSVLVCLSAIFFNIFCQYWQWIFDSEAIKASYSELGLIFSITLLAQFLASFIFARIKIGHNYMVGAALLLISALAYSGVDYVKLQAIMLVAALFFISRYISLYLGVLLHDNIEDCLRATYESFLSTIVRVVLLFSFTLSAILVKYFGFLSLVYLFSLFIIYFLACILRKKIKLTYV